MVTRSASILPSIPMTIFHTIVVDRSDSMNSMHGSHITQLRNYLEEQKKAAEESGNTIFVTVITFDTVAQTWIDTKNILDIEIPTMELLRLWASPRGMTRMYDTVIDAVTNQKSNTVDYIKTLPTMVRELDPHIQRWIYVITDGYDNSSLHTVNEMQTKMLSERRSGLGTILLAANIGDAQELAETFGFNKETALTIGSDAITSGLGMEYANNMARQISSLGTIPSGGFTPLERSTSIPQPNNSDEDTLGPPPPYSPSLLGFSMPRN